MLLDTQEYVSEFNTPGPALAIAGDELRRAVRACGIEQTKTARTKFGDVRGFFGLVPEFRSTADRGGG